MSFDVELTVMNYTRFNVDVVHNDEGKIGEIQPGGGEWLFHTTDPNNAISLRFWDAAVEPKAYYMQGGVNFGPEAGVYMDRGWMAPDDQSIALNATANGTVFNQTENGGAQVLPWDGFENGGQLFMNFNPVA